MIREPLALHIIHRPPVPLSLRDERIVGIGPFVFGVWLVQQSFRLAFGIPSDFEGDVGLVGVLGLGKQGKVGRSEEGAGSPKGRFDTEWSVDFPLS